MANVAGADIQRKPANFKPEVAGIRRNSTGNSGIQISEQKPIPNYLRASIGTCHDYCKYGRRRSEVEMETEIPRRLRKTVKSTLHKEKLVNKDTEKEVSHVSGKRTDAGNLKGKLLRTQRSSLVTGSNNRQNGRNNPSNSRLCRKTGVSATASPSSVKLSKSRKINLPKRASRLEDKKCNKKSDAKETTDYESVPEKTLYVIELNESQSENKKIDSRTGDGKEASYPRKLDFKKGELLDVPSEDSNPRTLKFRPMKTLDNKQEANAEFIEKNLRELVSKDSPIEVDNSPRPVVLRHQTIGKRDTSPSLYNSMIEVTARKLARARKSRVKALVGAFETVITLQDKKRSKSF